MEPLIGASASQGKFDARKFVWLGSMNNEVSGFFIRQGAPAANLSEILAGTPLQVGSTGAAGDQQAFTVALNSLLGTRLKPIAGYPGTQEILLAIERGELDGIVGYSWGVARAGNKDDLASGRLKIVMQLGLAKHKDLPNVPMLDEFVHAPQDRQVLDLIFSRQAMGRPLIAPPGLDPAVAELLRAGVRRGDARSAAHCGGRQDGSGAWIRARRRSAGHGRAALPISARSDCPRPGDRGRQLDLQPKRSGKAANVDPGARGDRRQEMPALTTTRARTFSGLSVNNRRRTGSL